MAEPSARPLISVVVPLFNKARYVAEALNSVERQSFVDYEVIVVDDGSSDESALIVSAIASSRMRLVQQANAGVSSARNNGVTLASGEFIAFLDADDVWNVDHLYQLSKLAQHYPRAGLFANEFTEVRGNLTKRTAVNEGIEYRLVHDYVSEAAHGTINIFTSATMLRRSVFLLSGGFERGENRGEDLDLWLRIGMQVPVAVSTYVGARYRRVPAGLTSTEIVRGPDVLMRRIETFLSQPTLLSSHKRSSLRELHGRMALAHATDALERGDIETALLFAKLADRTVIWRRRLSIVKLLCLLPGWMRNLSFKVRRAFHE